MRITSLAARLVALAAFGLSSAAGEAGTAADGRPIAFLHASVVPMDKEGVMRDQTVVVAGGRITRIGPAATTTAPKGARLVDATGLYLAPGLADMHVHVYVPQELTLYVANGVTTIFNLNGHPVHLGWRSRIAKGELLGPTMYSAGPTFDRARSAGEAVLEVDRQSAAGYDAVKIYNQVSAAEYPALIAEAKKKNLILIGHVARGPGFEATLAAGQSIAHAEEYVYTFFNPDKQSEVVHPLDTMQIPKAVALTKEAGISVIPTLVAFHNIARQVTGLEDYLRNPDLAYLAPFMREQLDAEHNGYVKRLSKDLSAGLFVSYEFQRQLVKQLHEAGVPILAGTDASWLGVPGFSLIEEIENFQDLGFTPYAALKTATVDPARLLRQENEFGTITVGKRADFLLTRKNPLDDVRNLHTVAGVMVDGRWIPDSERRQLLQSVPVSHKETFARLMRDADRDAPAFDAYLSSNDPFGVLSAAVLGNLAATRGPKAAVETVTRVRKTNPQSPLLAEDTLNQLGYDLVGRKQLEAAIEIFRLNTELYPKSGNACDSLAETYLAAGNKELARQYYAKALEVDPGYGNAAAAREILKTMSQ